MNRIRLFILVVPVMLVACHSISDKDTIAKLRHIADRDQGREDRQRA